MELEFEVPSWDQLYNMLLNLAEKINKSEFKLDVIVGVSRGSWPPARTLSDLLGNPNLANVRTEFYFGVSETGSGPVLTQPVSVDVIGKKVLVVDEVVDTGKSLTLVKNHLIEKDAEEVRIATIYYKPWSIVKPDYYEKETSRWIVFPWEIKETVHKLIRQCNRMKIPAGREIVKLVKAGISAELVSRFSKEDFEEQD